MTVRAGKQVKALIALTQARRVQRQAAQTKVAQAQSAVSEHEAVRGEVDRNALRNEAEWAAQVRRPRLDIELMSLWTWRAVKTRDELSRADSAVEHARAHQRQASAKLVTAIVLEGASEERLLIARSRLQHEVDEQVLARIDETNAQRAPR